MIYVIGFMLGAILSALMRERKNYDKGLREGYQKGFADGFCHEDNNRVWDVVNVEGQPRFLFNIKDESKESDVAKFTLAMAWLNKK